MRSSFAIANGSTGSRHILSARSTSSAAAAISSGIPLFLQLVQQFLPLALQFLISLIVDLVGAIHTAAAQQFALGIFRLFALIRLRIIRLLIHLFDQVLNETRPKTLKRCLLLVGQTGKLACI